MTKDEKIDQQNRYNSYRKGFRDGVSAVAYRRAFLVYAEYMEGYRDGRKAENEYVMKYREAHNMGPLSLLRGPDAEPDYVEEIIANRTANNPSLPKLFPIQACPPILAAERLQDLTDARKLNARLSAAESREKALLEKFRALIEAEPEYPTPWPEERFKDVPPQILARAAVAETKRVLLEKLLALASILETK